MVWEYVCEAGCCAFGAALFLAESEKVNLGCFFTGMGIGFLIAAIALIVKAFTSAGMLSGFMSIVVAVVVFVLVVILVDKTGDYGPLDDGFMNL